MMKAAEVELRERHDPEKSGKECREAKEKNDSNRRSVGGIEGFIKSERRQK